MSLEEIFEKALKSLKVEKREVFTITCPICGKVIETLSREQAITLMRTHIANRHKELVK